MNGSSGQEELTVFCKGWVSPGSLKRAFDAA